MTMSPILKKLDKQPIDTAAAFVLETETKFNDNIDEPINYIPIIHRLKEYISQLVLITVDYLIIILALLTALHLRNLVVPNEHVLESSALLNKYMFFIIPLIYLSLMYYDGLYRKRLPLWKKIEAIVKISFYATGITIGIMFLENTVSTVSRIFIMLSGIISIIYLLVSGCFVKTILVSFGMWFKPVLMVGAGRTAELIAAAYEKDSSLGYKIVGIIEDNPHHSMTKKFPILGGFNEIESVILETGIRDVIIAAPGLPSEKLLNIVNRIQPKVSNLTVVPNLQGLPLSNIEVNTLYSQKTILLTLRNNLLNGWNRLLKCSFDIVLGTIIFLCIWPILLLIGILVKLESPGPVLYIAKRIGKKGKEFNCYKFRTMFINNDEMLHQYFENNSKAKHEWERFAKLKEWDPRVTKIGRIIRKFSLDELPQLVNVLMGEMSLVGPRPYLPREKEKMGYYYDVIVETVPGMTGLWQVNGRNEIEFNGRLAMDEWYVQNWSFWMDIMLLIDTIRVVFQKKGAY